MFKQLISIIVLAVALCSAQIAFADSRANVVIKSRNVLDARVVKPRRVMDSVRVKIPDWVRDVQFFKIDSDGDGLADSIEQQLGTDPHNNDTDNDGILDGQEDANHNGVYDPGETNPLNADTDGDGLIDGLEVAYGTDPNNIDTDGDGLLDGEEDMNHNGIWEPQYGESNPLMTDTDNDGILDGDDACPVNPDPSCAVAGIDTDADGLTDPIEMQLGTDPANSDTDGDGILDGQEDANHNGIVDPNETNPLMVDTDNDGIMDGSDQCPLNPDPSCAAAGIDTDADGLTDPIEIQLGTDPANSDTDGDGLFDGEEDMNHNGIWEPQYGESNPLMADTDGDGLVDGLERAYGTDVNNADTDGDGISDGEEDMNHNGLYDPMETNALNADTDGDGVWDGDDACPVNPDPSCA